MAAVILFDLLIPSLLVILIGAVFLLIRRERIPVTGPSKAFTLARFALLMLGWAILWTVEQYTLILPLQSHLLNDMRDVDAFAEVYGNLSNLLLFLLASWTLAAVVEEFAFRGFFQNRIISLFRNPAFGTVTAIIVTAALFGVMHAEQGIIGMLVTAVNSVFFSVSDIGIKVSGRPCWHMGF